MTFICGVCSIYTKPGIKATHVVLETRPKIYPPRPNAHIFIPKDQPHHKMITDDPGGVGTEIVKEVLACPACGKAAGELEESKQG
jgi:hypothetical protein